MVTLTEHPTAHWAAQETLSPSGSSARPGASGSTAFSSSAKGTSTESWPAISRTITDKAADARTKQTKSGATPEWIPDSGRATHELAALPHTFSATYARLDDGRDKAKATLRVANEQTVQAGQFYTLLPPEGDIHYVKTVSDMPSVSIHLLANDTACVWRHKYDPLAGTVTAFRSGYSNVKCPPA